MKQTGRAALAKWAARGKQYLVMIRPVGQGPRHAAAPLRRRGAPDLRGADRRRGGEGRGAEARGPARRADRAPTSSTPRTTRTRSASATTRRSSGRSRARRSPPRPRRPRAQIIDLMEALKASLAAKAAPRRGEAGDEAGGAVARRRPAPRAEPACRLMPDSLARVEPRRRRAASAARACARWCREVARTKVKRFRTRSTGAGRCPGFGDPRARLLVVGLAPAAHGGNRTGRVFTGDRSGDFLFAALHRAGFASQPTSVGRDDGLRAPRLLHRARRPLRAARPTSRRPAEIARCREYLAREWALLAGRAGRPRPRPHRDGRLPGHAPRDGPRRRRAASPSATASSTTSAAASASSARTTSRSRTRSPAGSRRARFDAVLAKVKRHLAPPRLR